MDEKAYAMLRAAELHYLTTNGWVMDTLRTVQPGETRGWVDPHKDYRRVLSFAHAVNSQKARDAGDFLFSQLAAQTKSGRLPNRACYDCNAGIGENHTGYCDIERCARCGGQAISCHCIYEVNEIDYRTLETTHPEVYSNGPTPEMEARWEKEWGSRRLPWTGEWPNLAECREYGFWAIFGPDMDPPRTGWVPVPGNTPGAQENLKRLYEECVWDQEKKRFVRKET
jgi:hypothetical protein